MQVVSQRVPTEAEWGELLLRLEGVQARPLQRRRALPRSRDRWASAPAR